MSAAGPAPLFVGGPYDGQRHVLACDPALFRVQYWIGPAGAVDPRPSLEGVIDATLTARTVTYRRVMIFDTVIYAPEFWSTEQVVRQLAGGYRP